MSNSGAVYVRRELQDIIENADALGVLFIDGDAHDEWTIGTLRIVCDAVVFHEGGRAKGEYS